MISSWCHGGSDWVHSIALCCIIVEPVSTLLTGFDGRGIEMARTTINVTGDVMEATLSARSEGDLDEAIYDSVEIAPVDDAEPAPAATK